jgi:hypothetical protein
VVRPPSKAALTFLRATAAQAFGLTILPSILASADEVIE